MFKKRLLIWVCRKVRLAYDVREASYNENNALLKFSENEKRREEYVSVNVGVQVRADIRKT
jgi:hypothetical protein